MYGINRSDASALLQAFLATVLIFSMFLGAAQVYAAAVTLSVNVQTAITFTTTNQGFANTGTNITPGTPLMATTTLSVTTNDASGWNVTLSGDNKNTSNHNLQRTGDTTVQITDQTEWIPNAATTSPGNAAQISALVNSGNVLAYRVAASTTNGTAFLATSWWGTQDNYVTSNANTLYAGISSSTVSRMIGNAGAGSYSASAHLNDVQYYLNVGASQKTGAYTAPITYTATGN
jgi:hypothetical protein